MRKSAILAAASVACLALQPQLATAKSADLAKEVILGWERAVLKLTDARIGRTAAFRTVIPDSAGRLFREIRTVTREQGDRFYWEFESKESGWTTKRVVAFDGKTLRGFTSEQSAGSPARSSGVVYQGLVMPKTKEDPREAYRKGLSDAYPFTVRQAAESPFRLPNGGTMLSEMKRLAPELTATASTEENGAVVISSTGSEAARKAALPEQVVFKEFASGYLPVSVCNEPDKPGFLGTEVKITHEQGPHGLTLPVSITHEFFVVEDGEQRPWGGTKTEAIATVTDQPLPPSVFEVSFPKGTRLVNPESAERVIVGEGPDWGAMLVPVALGSMVAMVLIAILTMPMWTNRARPKT